MASGQSEKSSKVMCFYSAFKDGFVIKHIKHSPHNFKAFQFCMRVDYFYSFVLMFTMLMYVYVYVYYKSLMELD